MSDKFRNKYRIASARAPWWDYEQNGAYFVTICTQNRYHFFGEIKKGIMHLSRTGVIADIMWHQIPHRTPHVALGEFVVMPNHIHGILILDKPDGVTKNDDVGGNGDSRENPVETLPATSLRGCHRNHRFHRHYCFSSPHPVYPISIFRGYDWASSQIHPMLRAAYGGESGAI